MKVLADYGALIAGALLAIAGVVILLTQRAASDFSAYGTVEATGLAQEDPTGPDPTLGVLLASLGALVVFAWVVYRLIRRRAASRA
ncbi:hypothetical protein H4J02_05045 [Protaetiibacter sp. SSC-01]|uniref:hypothetical protein n=1 Tax=Protaetiibacter sp. SSC-01 TaxID=2759943 RepID=UPI00165708AE|nr:hypothetical protein [Protaetiibacter sp. SSC-01]QNO38382.1 hypothetical protein H4J02_05045 [Protaetiibacter sp. SSC-01]